MLTFHIFLPVFSIKIWVFPMITFDAVLFEFYPSFQCLLYNHYYRYVILLASSFCSNIVSKSSNYPFFNIIKILNKFKIFHDHQIRKFSNNIDMRKLDFLSLEKISERSCFVNKDISQKIYVKNNIQLMFKQVLFDDFDSMLLSSLLASLKNINRSQLNYKI